MDYGQIIRTSKLFQDISLSLENIEISTIRCLALGSPSESKNARFQLALLIELQQLLDAEVSLYDPIFNEKDNEILKDFTIEKEFTSDSSKTLYFLPHASLELTEEVLNTNQPKYFLANDVIAHTDRLTKKTCRQLPHPFYNCASSRENKVDDGFTRVSRKRFKEPVITYDIDSVYFDKVQISRYLHTNKNDAWGTSFTDLAYHYIS